MNHKNNPMTFEEAVAIFIKNYDDGVGSVLQPSKYASYIVRNTWFLRNCNGHLARVGGKCGRVLDGPM